MLYCACTATQVVKYVTKYIFFGFLHVEGKSFPLLFAPFFIHLSVEAREKGNKKLISHFIGDVIT